MVAEMAFYWRSNYRGFAEYASLGGDVFAKRFERLPVDQS
jgi:hypothetical protein